MRRAMLATLAVYKRWISPALPVSCRFVPTCSEYAVEAIERHGVMRGVWLTAGRLVRCNPFARSGYDPVPQSVECGYCATALSHAYDACPTQPAERARVNVQRWSCANNREPEETERNLA